MHRDVAVLRSVGVLRAMLNRAASPFYTSLKRRRRPVQSVRLAHRERGSPISDGTLRRTSRGGAHGHARLNSSGGKTTALREPARHGRCRTLTFKIKPLSQMRRENSVEGWLRAIGVTLRKTRLDIAPIWLRICSIDRGQVATIHCGCRVRFSHRLRLGPWPCATLRSPVEMSSRGNSKKTASIEMRKTCHLLSERGADQIVR